jgi:hypothetical protein
LWVHMVFSGCRRVRNHATSMGILALVLQTMPVTVSSSQGSSQRPDSPEAARCATHQIRTLEWSHNTGHGESLYQRRLQ